MLRDGLYDAFSGEHSGWHTEDLVDADGHHPRGAGPLGRAFAAAFRGGAGSGQFDAEIVRVEIEGRKGPQQFARDEQPRPTPPSRRWPRLQPAFRHDGTITAGNAPGLNSGAAAMVVAERGFAEAHGIEPFARLVAYGVAAVEPGMFGLGPVPAVQMALARAGWQFSDVERVEINEAFAAVPIAVLRKLGLPRTSSTSKAARSPMAIRSARPARC